MQHNRYYVFNFIFICLHLLLQLKICFQNHLSSLQRLFFFFKNSFQLAPLLLNSLGFCLPKYIVLLSHLFYRSFYLSALKILFHFLLTSFFAAGNHVVSLIIVSFSLAPSKIFFLSLRYWRSLMFHYSVPRSGYIVIAWNLLDLIAFEVYIFQIFCKVPIHFFK